jgi:hypothetical protein
MTKIKESNKIDFCSVFEDPRPTINDIYFYGDGHDQTTLAPIFDKGMKFRSNATSWAGRGYNAINNTASAPVYTYAGIFGSTLALSKPSTHVDHTTATSSWRTNLDYCYAYSLDPNYQNGRAQYFTDGSQHMILWNSFGPYQHVQVYWSNANLSNTLDELNPTYDAIYNGSHTGSQQGNYTMAWMYRNPNNNYISGMFNRFSWTSTGSASYPDNSYHRPTVALGRLSSFPAYSSQQDIVVTYQFNLHPQFIGPSTIDAEPIYLFTSNLNDYTHQIHKHNTSANTRTILHTFDSIPLIDSDGTNSGGARSQTGPIGYQGKLASRTFMDYQDSDDLGFYSPYFDSDQDYHPFYFQWDRSTDTFTRNEDIVITGDLSSNYILNLDGHSNNSVDGSKSFVYNETFTYNGDRYLTVFPLEGGYRVHDAIETARKFVTYSVNAANPKSLTHHSVVTVPYTIRNIAWLNDARTALGVICERVFYYYTFDNVNGWDLKANLPYQYWAVGYDKLGNIWGVSDADGTYTDIHLISPSLPTTVTISAASESYNYVGSIINSTLSVSAFNLNGVRVETNVTLTIEGSTMTFDDDTTSKTITTSSSADISVAIKIIGAGLSNVVASITI